MVSLWIPGQHGQRRPTCHLPPSFSSSKFSELLNCPGNFPMLLHLRETRDQHKQADLLLPASSPRLAVKQLGNPPWCHHAPEYFSTDKREELSVGVDSAAFMTSHSLHVAFIEVLPLHCCQLKFSIHLHPSSWSGRSQVVRTDGLLWSLL